ncbi:hypothetical protein P5704_026960 (plasmid) [Pseudomonas sp. FeN3W]|nr:hypothetical protein P5704_026960 [Pseudomonas sp. FeN3W]
MRLKSIQQKGFALTSLMIAILISTLLAAIAAGKWATLINESAAESTGKYMLSVRGATLSAISAHIDALQKNDVSGLPLGTLPEPPSWAVFEGDSTVISVRDLKNAGFLRSDFPDAPPLGRSVHISLQRSDAACPGLHCSVDAYVYTCWPISTAKPRGYIDIDTCSPPPSGVEFNNNLIGSAIMATNGYGGSNSINASKFNGPLFNIDSSVLGLPANSPGHLAVSASLNSTMHNQYVRQGDTRNIRLLGDLGVKGTLTTDKGMKITEKAVPGASCNEEGLYVTSANNALLSCMGSRWFPMNAYSVQSSSILQNNEILPAITCPANTQPFAMASLSTMDATMTGSDIDIRGNLSGSMSGTGSTNASGTVVVTGSFSGTTSSSSASKIRVAQSASIVGNRVVIAPAGAGARAQVIQGCKFI